MRVCVCVLRGKEGRQSKQIQLGISSTGAGFVSQKPQHPERSQRLPLPLRLWCDQLANASPERRQLALGEEMYRGRIPGRM